MSIEFATIQGRPMNDIKTSLLEHRSLEAPVYETLAPILESRTGTLEQKVAALNKANRAYAETVGTVFLSQVLDNNELNKSADSLNDAAKKQVTQLLEKRQIMIDQVDNITKLVEGPLAGIGEVIKSTYQEADKTSDRLGYHDSVDRAAMRVIFQGGKILPLNDFDGTATDGVEHIKKMPTQKLEELLQSHQIGRDKFTEASLVAVHAIQRNFSLMTEIGATHVVVRPGFNEFIQYAKEQMDVRPIVLTANYIQIIEGALTKVPNADGNLRIVGVTPDSVISTRKGLILQYFARTNPDRAVTMAGDSQSDEPNLIAKDNVAFYFALKNESFETLCQEHNALYFPYESFTEIQGWFELIQTRAREIYPKLGLS
jgi:2-hydroxy-3-keto-5-methylthiopentenyl-1-phosphate phosphatase